MLYTHSNNILQIFVTASNSLSKFEFPYRS